MSPDKAMAVLLCSLTLGGWVEGRLFYLCINQLSNSYLWPAFHHFGLIDLDPALDNLPEDLIGFFSDPDLPWVCLGLERDFTIDLPGDPLQFDHSCLPYQISLCSSADMTFDHIRPPDGLIQPPISALDA